MKKILSVCLALVMLLACMSVQAFAQSEPVFSAGSAEANPGDTIEIPIIVENNPGIIALAVSISFDRNVLTLQNATADTSVFPADKITFGGTYDTDTFNILWEDGASTTNFTGSGTLAKLTFLVSQDAPIGETTVSVSYSRSSVLDVNLDEVAFGTRNGVVTVVPAEVGGWSFTEGSTLYTYEGESGINYVCGLDIFYPIVSDYVETTGGWSFEVEANEFGMESTGAKLVIYDENNDVAEEYYAVLFGDINGDGAFNLTDTSLLADAMGSILDDAWADYIITDEFPQSFAADSVHDLSLDLSDMSVIMDQIGSVEDIDQSPWW